MQPVEPILAYDLFPGLHERLMELLRSLCADDWHRPTLCKAWNVKDIAAHLLDTAMRTVSCGRDTYQSPKRRRATAGYAGLVEYLNDINAEWVLAFRRVSPKQIVEWLDHIHGPSNESLRAIKPFEPSPVSVAWAGEDVSPGWFHVARELTERWTHQQQIRVAVGAEGLNERKYLHPVLDTFLRGLPHSYRAIPAQEGTRVEVHITGEAGGVWTLLRTGERWALHTGRGEASPNAEVQIDQDLAWRIFTKGVTPNEAEHHVAFKGDRNLARQVLGTVSVMA